MAQRHSTVSLDRIEDLIEGIGEAELHDQMTFVEMVAGDLDAHPDALPIGLMLLADMDRICIGGIQLRFRLQPV